MKFVEFQCFAQSFLKTFEKYISTNVLCYPCLYHYDIHVSFLKFAHILPPFSETLFEGSLFLKTVITGMSSSVQCYYKHTAILYEFFPNKVGKQNNRRCNTSVCTI